MPEISLIISTYNWPKALNLCLLSVKNQTLLPKEVLIADDGSSPETRLLIDNFRKTFSIPLIHVWHDDQGHRKTIILNKSIKKATGEYIVQVDGDVILDKNFIKDHHSLCTPDTFIRGSRAHIKHEMLPSIYKHPRTDFNFFSKGLVNRFNALRLPFLSFLFKNKSTSSRSVRGSNLAFWKSDFVLVNGYDNDLKGWGHEDEELATRLVNNDKFKIAIKFKAIQFHLSHKQLPLTAESRHADAVKQTRNLKLKVCENGYAQS